MVESKGGWRRWLRCLLVATLALAACSAVKKKEEPPLALRVGTSASYPPLTFLEDGQPRGVEVDFAEALAAELGRRAEIVVVPFPDLIGALNANRIDIIMTGMSRTPRRENLVTFTQPYLRVGQMALVRKGDERRFRTPASYDEAGVRVGFERNTTGAKWVRANCKSARQVEFASKDDGLAALRRGEIDIFIHDAPYVWTTIGSPLAPDPGLAGRYTPLTEEYLAWAVRKDDDELAAAVDAVVERWRENGKIAAVLDRWIKVRKITLTVEE